MPSPEEIGQAVIEHMVQYPMFKVLCVNCGGASENPMVVSWNATAAEQLGEFVARLMQERSVEA